MTRYNSFLSVFFYINQGITSRVEIEISDEMRVEVPAPIMGSTCVSSAMVPKMTKLVNAFLAEIRSSQIYHLIEKQSDWKFGEQNLKKNLKKLKVNENY